MKEARVGTQFEINTKNTKYDCEICQDRELVLLTDEKGEQVARPCECKERKSLAKLFKASGLTEEQQALTLNDYEVTKETSAMFNTIKDYIWAFPDIRQRSEVNRGFALMGLVPGTGKTMLAITVANYLLKRKIPVLFVSTIELFAELRVAQFSQEGGAELEQRIERLTSAEVVIFDDVAKEKPSEWVQGIYFRIIDNRYRNRKITCFTSNYDFEELADTFDKFGAMISSRLYAMTRDYQVIVPSVARDYRVR